MAGLNIVFNQTRPSDKDGAYSVTGDYAAFLTESQRLRNEGVFGTVDDTVDFLVNGLKMFRDKSTVTQTEAYNFYKTFNNKEYRYNKTANKYYDEQEEERKSFNITIEPRYSLIEYIEKRGLPEQTKADVDAAITQQTKQVVDATKQAVDATVDAAKKVVKDTIPSVGIAIIIALGFLLWIRKA